MNQLKSILVGIDFSPASQNALRQASRLAAANRARLHVFHCVDAGLVAEASCAAGRNQADLSRELVREAQALMRSALRRAGLPAGTDARVDCDLPVESVLRHFQRVRPDLLVLGVNGASNSGPGAGMFATRCLRKVDTKVLLVAARQRGPFRRVLACVDFSETSRRVIEQVQRVASQDQSRICCLHVFHPPWRRFGFRADSPRASVDYADQHRRRLLERLRALTAPLAGLAVTHRVAESTHRGHGLAEFAEDMAASLVILGRRGLSNLKYVLLGSTAEWLARESGRSLLVVPPASGIDS